MNVVENEAFCKFCMSMDNVFPVPSALSCSQKCQSMQHGLKNAREKLKGTICNPCNRFVDKNQVTLNLTGQYPVANLMTSMSEQSKLC